MNANLLTKILGWGQFALQLLGGLATTGIPATPIGWIGLAGSLATAIGLHASAESTPTAGTPPK